MATIPSTGPGAPAGGVEPSSGGGYHHSAVATGTHAEVHAPPGIAPQLPGWTGGGKPGPIKTPNPIGGPGGVFSNPGHGGGVGASTPHSPHPAKPSAPGHPAKPPAPHKPPTHGGEHTHPPKKPPAKAPPHHKPTPHPHVKPKPPAKPISPGKGKTPTSSPAPISYQTGIGAGLLSSITPMLMLAGAALLVWYLYKHRKG